MRRGRKRLGGGIITGEEYSKDRHPPFPLKELKNSLHRYIEARSRSRLSSEILDSETEKLYSCFRDYVKSRKSEEVQGFSEVLAEFYSEVLGLNCENKDIKSSLTKRFKKLVRKYNVNDPQYQRTLDDFSRY